MLSQWSLIFVLLFAQNLLAASCEDEFGQMLLVRMPIHPKAGGVALFKWDFEGTTDKASVAQMIQKLQSNRSVPLFVATDHEGGLVQRLRPARGFTSIPSARDLGASGTPEDVYRYGRIAGQELREVGVNMNLGPVADIAWKGNGVINSTGRAYSESGDKVAEYVLANVQSLAQEKIIPTLKHFPGHGTTVEDSHAVTAIVKRSKQELLKNDLLPYITVAQSEWPAMVLVGHLALPNAGLKDGKIPASLSHEVVTGWLKNEIGFKGLIMTDDMAMGGVRKYYSFEDASKKAVLAGIDILSLGRGVSLQTQSNIIKSVCAEASRNPKMRARIQESYQRILEYKRRFEILPAGQ